MSLMGEVGDAAGDVKCFLEVDGQRVMTGDEVSLSIVFGNLVGTNFRDRPVWREQTHRQYLDYMTSVLGVDLSEGVRVRWGATDGSVMGMGQVELVESGGAEACCTPVSGT